MPVSNDGTLRLAAFDSSVVSGGTFINQGEVCSAGSRVLVEASMYDEALEALSTEAAAFAATALVAGALCAAMAVE